jgi:SNF2 family DNA or RNA helicase
MSALNLDYLFEKLSLTSPSNAKEEKESQAEDKKKEEPIETKRQVISSTDSISEWNAPISELYHIQLRKPYVLYPYQLQIVKWIEYRESIRFEGIKGCLLNVFMGAGKGLMVLCRLVSDLVHKTKSQIKVGPTLFIVPKSLVPTIKGECVKFFGSQLRVLVYFKEYLPDKSFFDSIQRNHFYQYHVVITTYDVIVAAAKKSVQPEIHSAPECVSQGAILLLQIPWYRVIVDESHTFNNPKGTLFQALLQVRAEHKIALSGTPLRNYETDMYVQLKFLGMTTIDKPRQWSEKLFIEHRFKEVIFTLESKDADLKLPLLTETTVDCILSPVEQALYDKIFAYNKVIYQQFKGKTQSGKRRFSDILAAIIKLRKVCCSLHLLKPEDRIDVHYEGHSSKIQAILATLETKIPPHEKVVLFTDWVKFLQLVAARLPPQSFLLLEGSQTGKKKDALIEEWKHNPKTRFLLLSYQIGCQGLTLIECRYMFCLAQWWSPVVIAQAMKRIHRIGQVRDCFVYHFVVPDSIESKIIGICQKKKALADKYFRNTTRKDDFSWKELQEQEKKDNEDVIQELGESLFK